MIGVFQSARERTHAAEAWAELFDEPAKVICPVCDGVGEIGVFDGHGWPERPVRCRKCWGEGEIDPEELP